MLHVKEDGHLVALDGCVSLPMKVRMKGQSCISSHMALHVPSSEFFHLAHVALREQGLIQLTVIEVFVSA